VVIVRASALEPGATVLVAGATGGVGQLATAALLEKGFKVRAIARSHNTTSLKGFGPNCEVVVADLREASQVPDLLTGVSAVVCAIGTTAFPSSRWNGNNGPRPADWTATSNLINAAKQHQLARFTLVTSAGTQRQKELPWCILNLFGVLRYKADSERLLMASGLPWTIIRPSRLTDGPYTSFDLNTLLQATAGSRRDVTLALTDRLSGEASRIAVAEAVVQSFLLTEAENKAFSVSSMEGEGPGTEAAKWKALFTSAT